MKKLKVKHTLLLILLLFSLASLDFAHANDKNLKLIDKIKGASKINLDNVSSYNGTYQIERFVLLTKNKVLIDTSNAEEVESFKGELTIELNKMTKIIDSTFKFQFKEKNPVVINNKIKKNPYEYIFFKRKIELVKDIYADSSNIKDNIVDAGLHYYKDENKLLWEFPLTKHKRAIVILEKTSNNIKNIKDFKYPLL